MKHQNKILKDYKKLRPLFDKGAVFTVLDTETTGLSPATCHVIEIGAIMFNKDGIISSYSQLFNPQQIIPKEIEKLTNITNEMIKDAPLLSQKFPDFLDFVKDTIIVGHNVQFDLRFLFSECIQLNLQPLQNKAIDTLQFSIWAYPELEKHKQEFLADYFKIEKGSVHRAYDDASTCMKLFLKLLESPKLIKDKN